MSKAGRTGKDIAIAILFFLLISIAITCGRSIQNDNQDRPPSINVLIDE